MSSGFCLRSGRQKLPTTSGLGDVAVFEKRPARNRSRIELLMMKITTKAQ